MEYRVDIVKLQIEFVKIGNLITITIHDDKFFILINKHITLIPTIRTKMAGNLVDSSALSLANRITNYISTLYTSTCTILYVIYVYTSEFR